MQSLISLPFQQPAGVSPAPRGNLVRSGRVSLVRAKALGQNRRRERRSSKNPFRHGLSVPSVGSEAQLKDLSRQFAGEASDAESLAQTARAADAQLDLERIRKAQSAMIERVRMLGAVGERPFHPDLEEPGLRFVPTDRRKATRGRAPRSRFVPRSLNPVAMRKRSCASPR